MFNIFKLFKKSDDSVSDNSLSDNEHMIENPLSRDEFEVQGFSCKESEITNPFGHVSRFLKITNKSANASSVEVVAEFKKDGKVVAKCYDYMDVAPKAYRVAKFICYKDFDEVVYTFGLEDCEDAGLVCTGMNITYEISDDGTVTGELTNESGQAVYLVTVYMVLMNEDGDVVGADDYLLECDTFKYGEKAAFEMDTDQTSFDDIQFLVNSYAEE